MIKKHLLHLALGICLTIAFCVSLEAQRRNVIFIMTDNQHPATLTQGIVERVLPTFHKYFQNEGITFPNYCNSSGYCSPSRRILDSGKLSKNTVDNNGDANVSVVDYLAYVGDKRVPIWMKRGGYNTAMVGKWGNPDYADQLPPLHDTLAGYDIEYGILSGKYVNQEYTVKRNGQYVSEYSHCERNATVMLDYTIQAIDELKAKPEPFYITILPKNPHHSTNQEDYSIQADIYLNRYTVTRPTTPTLLAFPGTSEFLEKHPDHLARATNSYLTTNNAEVLDDVAKNWEDNYKSMWDFDNEFLKPFFEYLVTNNLLDNTDIYMTTDNGRVIGEHLIWGGGLINPYRQNYNFGLFAHIGGQSTARTMPTLLAHHNLGATFADYAGMLDSLASYTGNTGAKKDTLRYYLDGKSFLSVIDSAKNDLNYIGNIAAVQTYIYSSGGQSNNSPVSNESLPAYDFLATPEGVLISFQTSYTKPSGGTNTNWNEFYRWTDKEQTNNIYDNDKPNTGISQPYNFVGQARQELILRRPAAKTGFEIW